MSLLIVLMTVFGAAKALENAGQNLYSLHTDLKEAGTTGSDDREPPPPPAFPPVSSHIMQSSRLSDHMSKFSLVYRVTLHVVLNLPLTSIKSSVLV